MKSRKRSKGKIETHYFRPEGWCTLTSFRRYRRTYPILFYIVILIRRRKGIAIWGREMAFVKSNPKSYGLLL